MPSRIATKRRTTAMAALILTTVLVAAACNPVFGEPSGPVRHATLTSTQGYQYAYSGDETTVTAKHASYFTDGNVRELFWDQSTPFYDDQQTCLTWDDLAFTQEGQLLQPGLAMRIAPWGSGVRAVTVTENIWYAGVWLFNVHIWDTAADPAHPYTQLATFDAFDIVTEPGFDDDGNPIPMLIDAPWHVCARTQGSQFTVKVWTHKEAEPAWDDPTHAFTTTLPKGWDHAGYSGGYIGHLRDGQTATFSDFTTGPLCMAPDMVDTPDCQAKLEALAGG